MSAQQPPNQDYGGIIGKSLSGKTSDSHTFSFIYYYFELILIDDDNCLAPNFQQAFDEGTNASMLFA